MATAQNVNAQMATFNYPNLFTYFSMISPFLVILLFVFISIINSNLKGFIYLLGIFFLFFIILLFQKVLRIELPLDSSPYCQVFAFPIPLHGVPSFNSSIFIFTIVYLFLPMISNNIMNFPLLILLFVIYAIDTVTKISGKCTTPVGVILGSFLGLVWGLLWFFLIQTQNPELLYYDDLISNKIACSRPTQQQFKCAVFRNGEILQTL